MKSNLNRWLCVLGIGACVVGALGCGSDSDSATTTGSSAASGAASGTGSGGCVEEWSCTPWETSGADDQATRVCTEQSTCGTTEKKPIESTTLPALDENFFQCNVEPVLAAKCSQLGCHGTEQGRPLRLYARGRLRNSGENLTAPSACPQPATADECIGSLICKCRGPKTDTERRKNYDSARAFGLDSDGNPIAAGSEATSELIAQPIVGGKAHAGVHLFRAGDPDEQVILDWLGGATLASCNSQN